MTELATGESICDHGLREGLVFRSQDGTKSFKTDAEENKYDREKKIEKEFKDTWKSKM